MGRADDLRAMLSTPNARRIWWHELLDLGLFSVSLVPDAHNAVDVWRTAFQEGRRSIALDRLAEVKNLAPDLFRLIFLEYFAPPPKEKPPDV